ncbi:16S rRNA (guanine(527)-N(7))-methyltransferase RsmG [Aureliella helgolandensis]|nr:16S rRNA (guanine(527)-N(7))-methyltransferase RsmG [Aureliella helgolandensis]
MSDLPADRQSPDNAEDSQGDEGTTANAAAEPITDSTPAVTVPASQSLQEAIERMELTVDPACVPQLDAYCQALWGWNEKINLTRHTTYDTFVRRDLLDSLHLADLLAESEDVLDIGTGGGVPGLLLAILRPDLNVHVCDSVAKKSRAVDDMVKQLHLPVAVHASRVQDVVDDLRFHSLVTRAAGNISQLLTWLKDYWMSFDRLLAIKGPRWVDERGEARHRGLMNQITLRRVAAYPMPGTESESVILQFTRER